MNNLKTVLLLGVLGGMLLLAGELLGGREGLIIGLVVAVGINFFSYFFSDKMALKMYRAQPVSPQENPEVWHRIGPMTQNLTQRMGLPMPKLWVIPDESPNAFATGRNPKNASVAVTVGILRLMNNNELEGVIGHELGHVRNRDILISSIAATVGTAITFLARFAIFFGGSRDDDRNPMAALLMLILAPIAALLIQMAISRTREFAADAAAAQYTGSPDGLINGLRKLEEGVRRIPMNASPTHEHMFIVKPFGARGIGKLFSTHPPTEERIAHLDSLRGQISPSY